MFARLIIQLCEEGVQPLTPFDSYMSDCYTVTLIIMWDLFVFEFFSFCLSKLHVRVVTLKVFWVRIDATTCHQIDYERLLPVVYSEGAFAPASSSFDGTALDSVVHLGAVGLSKCG